jgi:hypothetical protein
MLRRANTAAIAKESFFMKATLSVMTSIMRETSPPTEAKPYYITPLIS